MVISSNLTQIGGRISNKFLVCLMQPFEECVQFLQASGTQALPQGGLAVYKGKRGALMEKTRLCSCVRHCTPTEIENVWHAEKHGLTYISNTEYLCPRLFIHCHSVSQSA